MVCWAIIRKGSEPLPYLAQSPRRLARPGLAATSHGQTHRPSDCLLPLEDGRGPRPHPSSLPGPRAPIMDEQPVPLPVAHPPPVQVLEQPEPTLPVLFLSHHPPHGTFSQRSVQMPQATNNSASAQARLELLRSLPSLHASLLPRPERLPVDILPPSG